MYEIPLSQIDSLADISAEAFINCDDPIGNFIFNDEPNHILLKKRFFRFLVTSCPTKAVRQATSSKMEAVSIWFPPGMDHSEDAAVEPPFTAQDFKSQNTMEKIQAVNEVIAALTAHLGQEPQWYLHLVAVRLEFVNQKYASLLIRPMLEKARNANLSCSLITQCQKNVLKYESWGFKVIKEMPVLHSEEKFYSMRHEVFNSRNF